MRRYIGVLLVLIMLTISIDTAYAHSPQVTSPTTENAIVLDSDRAILLGTAHGNGSERGFFYGAVNADIKVKSRPIEYGKMNVLVTGLSAETTYYVQAYVRSGHTMYLGNITQFTTPAVTEWTADKVIYQTSDERYNLIFGTTAKYYKVSAPPWGFNGRAEAAQHIVPLQVNIWRLSHGRKVPSTAILNINYKLKANVKAIFDEIYALDIQFPIIYLSSFSYRRMLVPWVHNNPYLSQHSFGTSIDINRYQNRFYRSKDKRNMHSAYYIPPEVISIFEKYGWTWGGNFKEGLDTMHFQYLGRELLG